ncbi:MAG: 4'-phosphopantetheinyl transferase family protein [Solirubrobacteraceae bacterium]
MTRPPRCIPAESYGRDASVRPAQSEEADLLERVLPGFVAWAETTEDHPDFVLSDAELRSLGRAVDRRRREFTAGRACARRALQRLGAPPAPVPGGRDGEPLWPSGVVGSITHCEGFRACAVAYADAAIALGIDAEPNLALPDGLLQDIAYGDERKLAAAAPPAAPGSPAVDLPRLLFSAKEAAYKAWFPLAGRRLGFDEVTVAIDLERGEFWAEVLVPGPLTVLDGRWAVQDGIIATAVVVEHS